PLENPTTRADTEAPASWSGVASTVSPSTTRTGRSATSVPGSAPSSSTSTRWPSVTRACLPPEAITAYIARVDPTGPSAPRPTPGSGLADDRVVHDHAPALAVRAGRRERGQQALADALAGHLHQAQLGDVEHLRAGLVPGQRRAEGADHLLTVVLDLHVD